MSDDGDKSYGASDERTTPTAFHCFTVDRLAVRVYADRAACGRAAADHVSRMMRQLIAEKDWLSLVFGAAPSQTEFFDALTSFEDIDWTRVIAFQMDEYIGISPDDPRRLRNYMERHFYRRKRPVRIPCMATDAADPHAECMRYADLLNRIPLDIACLGIGESGHIAYNDPHVADFGDREIVKVVEIDDASRLQQVHDGTVTQIEDSITSAYTLTIPTLMSAKYISCVAPGRIKAHAVARVLSEPIAPACPAAIMRRHQNSVLFLDRESASLIETAVPRNIITQSVS